MFCAERLNVLIVTPDLCAGATCDESVVQDNLCHITPENGLPEELRDEFIGIMERLGDVWVASKDGTLVRAARTMTDDEVFSTIDKVVYLYGRLCEERGQQ